MTATLNDLTEEELGTRIKVHYTQVEGTLDSFDLDYEDDVKVTISGVTYFLPREFPYSESILPEDYDPAVLLGVVEPWSPL